MSYIEEVYQNLLKKYKDQVEFLQATKEVLYSLEKVIIINEKKYREKNLLERLVEPDRVIRFDVKWMSDDGKENINKGYRVQHNNVLGPYKGGLRLHPSVNEGILKFLAFEQVFKNSLTTLPMGGGKGGSDFDPKGKSESEIKNFCYAFMDNLYTHIGEDKDVPAGDIGVGAREIGYFYDRYKQLTGKGGGVLTGKKIEDGGSLVRKEATGYGLVYMVQEMLNHIGDDIKGKNVVVSGAGNVAIYAVEKAKSFGANVITMSDSNGYIYDKDGIDIDIVKDIKEVKRSRIKEYIERKPSAEYVEGKRPFLENCDIALPCATQNEIDKEYAKKLIDNGCKLIAEGSNMSSTNDAIDVYKDNKILYMPGKCANSGGVSVSYFEMVQNKNNERWTFEEVDNKLREVMKNEYKNILNTCDKYNLKNDYVAGCNITGFERVADKM